jgi:hypothetical protein
MLGKIITERPPQVRLYESYLEKSNEFFRFLEHESVPYAMRGKFEICGLTKGIEEGGAVIITDIVLPEKEKILIVKPNQFQQAKKSKEADDYELIATKRGCHLTPQFYRRAGLLEKALNGVEHNHTKQKKAMPSGADLDYMTGLLSVSNPESQYLVSVLRGSRVSNQEFFLFKKSFLTSIADQDYLPENYLAMWVEEQYERFHATDTEVIKGK